MLYTELNPPHAKTHPIRILHVLGQFNRGGVETWLMHVLRRINRDRFQMDFLVHTTEPSAYDDEIRALGSQIIPCLYPSKPLQYARNFNRILKEYGSYDIVHSHVHHYSGYVLQLAQRAKVPIRIAHSHCDNSPVEAQATLYRRLYLNLTKRWINQHATLGLGCSQKAMADLFQLDWESNPRWQLLDYGINLEPFQEQIDSADVRAELGIPQDAFVIGHVGRFVHEKNHAFLLDVVAEAAKGEPKVHLLLIGEGELQFFIQKKVREMGLTNRVTFTGSRSDVPSLMRGAMDIFLFPSLCEGLGLALIEAQTAGLPCILSDVIPVEADIVKPLIHRLSLSQSPAEWVEMLLCHRFSNRGITPKEVLAMMAASPFNIERSLQQLEDIYQTQYARVQSKIADVTQCH